MGACFPYTAYPMGATDSVIDRQFRPFERIRRKSEYDRVFRARCSVLGEGMILYVCPNDLSHARLGIVVGRAYGGAVARNAVKRRLREAFRLNKAEAVGYDVVVLPKERERMRSMRMVEAAYRQQLARCIERWVRIAKVSP